MKLRLLLIAVAALAGGIFALWARNADVRAGETALARVERAARTHAVVTPAELTDEPFDRLVVVHGTNTAAQVRAALGIDWDRADDEAWHCCEPLPLWVFVRDDDVVAYFRSTLDLERVRPGRYRPDARLRIGASA